jgi:hypothetical protein
LRQPNRIGTGFICLIWEQGKTPHGGYQAFQHIVITYEDLERL